MIEKKKYRFFYHYYRQYKCMSVHYRDKCYKTDNVICNVSTETKGNKRQPNLVIQGWASDIKVEDNQITIN